MIVVDSIVWVDFLNGRDAQFHYYLTRMVNIDQSQWDDMIIVGHVIGLQ